MSPVVSLPLTDTRSLFHPLSRELVAVLRALDAEDWHRPTAARAWRVRDVVAHLIDTALRRLSFHRDGLTPAGRAPENDTELAALVNGLNASWVEVARRLSPRVLTDLYALAGSSLADFIESLDLESPARFPVSWAGQRTSPQWLDIGREFTEVWHHAAQIADAAKLAPLSHPGWLRAVLDIAMHALPAAYRDTEAREGVAVCVNVTGASAGTWSLIKQSNGGWDIEEGNVRNATTVLTLPDDIAWRLLFNGLAKRDLASLIRVDGDPRFAVPFLQARAIVM